MISRGQKFRNR